VCRKSSLERLLLVRRSISCRLALRVRLSHRIQVMKFGKIELSISGEHITISA
jgi:hypothetical protein